MSSIIQLVLSGAVCGGLVITAHCGSDASCEGSACTSPTVDGGGDGPATGDAEGGTPTDPCVATPNDPKCINEDSAFFISASGDDSTGAGTREKPFKTVTSTLSKLTDKKKRLYICEGTYAEDIALTAAHSGVSLFGGVKCDWTPAQVQPLFGKTDHAVKIDGATGVAFADIAIKSADATGAGNSSIAVFVNSGEVTLKHVAITAGTGQKGDNGTLTPFTYPTDLDGVNGATGGTAKTVACPGGLSSTGGKGGGSGFDGDDGLPTPPANKGAGSDCGNGGTGKNGVIGTTPAAPPGVTDFGLLSATGWAPNKGPDGTKGTPGQGGGGGYGGGGGVGGGGGGGSCGGAGGGGGLGGGASIAIASMSATVHITNCTLATVAAGNGGDGVAGQPGQTIFGSRGVGSNASSCNGGNGGLGAPGAAGGGGAGGVSVGVLYKGTKPEVDTATTTATTTGAKSTGGKGPGSVGVDGDNSPVLEAK